MLHGSAGRREKPKSDSPRSGSPSDKKPFDSGDRASTRHRRGPGREGANTGSILHHHTISDAFATGAPFEYFVEKQAREALEFLVAFVDRQGARSMSASDPVIIWNTRDPLHGRTPAEFETDLRRILNDRVEAAYISDLRHERVRTGFRCRHDARGQDREALFGSCLRFPEIYGLAASLDLLVYTPEEFASLTEDPSPGFWTSVVASMRRIV